MNAKLIKIKDALVSVNGLKVYHYWRPRLEAPFCVWQEDGEGTSVWSGNHLSEQVITGTIDYFTKTEFDPMIDNIQQALNNAENVGWELNSIQYENETNLIHYEWNFQVI